MMLKKAHFDCAIIVMLEEEMRLFIESVENIWVVDEKSDYITFTFCDKDHIIRKGIIYSGGSKMGNTEACSLMYTFSRNFTSKIYINIGVACAIDNTNTNIGDVILVDECISLSEKNASNSSFQVTSSEIDKHFVNSISRSLDSCGYRSEFSKKTQVYIQKINETLESNDKYDADAKEKIRKICNHESNSIKLGSCGSVPYVVKDSVTLNKIKEADRKLKSIDMEAFYFVHWFNLIKHNEPECIRPDSYILVAKSPSDNGIGNDKSILEEIGTRKLAMKNLADFVSTYITKIQEFEKGISDEVSLYNYIITSFCESNIDSFDKHHININEFNKLCKHLIKSETIKSDNYISEVCKLLKSGNRAIYITGQSGTGKSTFLSYIYRELIQDPMIKCIYIDISKLIYKTDKSFEYCLYLLERFMNSSDSKDLILIIDSADCGKFTNKEAAIIKIAKLLKDFKKKSISICVSDEHTLIHYLTPNITNSNKLEFINFSSGDKNFKTIIDEFYSYYINISPECPSIIKNAILAILSKADLSFIDFRLIKMLFENHPYISPEKSLEQFIDIYCHINTDIEDINNINTKITNNIMQNKDMFDIAIKNRKLLTNLYTRSYLMANCFYSIIDKNNLETLIRYKNVFSSNFNMFIKYIVNENPVKANDFCKKSLSIINNELICRSTKIQIMYNIYSLGNVLSKPNSSTYFKLLKDRIDSINIEIANDINDILEYRTIAIILTRKYGKEYSYYLNKFNNIMLFSDSTNYFARYNLMFHFYYYSQDEFTFDDIDELSTEFVNKHALCNTYKALRKSLKNPIGKDTADEFFKMNLITLSYIYHEFEKAEVFSEFKNECKALLKKSLLNFQKETAYNKFVDRIIELAPYEKRFNYPKIKII